MPSPECKQVKDKNAVKIEGILDFQCVGDFVSPCHRQIYLSNVPNTSGIYPGCLRQLFLGQPIGCQTAAQVVIYSPPGPATAIDCHALTSTRFHLHPEPHHDLYQSSSIIMRLVDALAKFGPDFSIYKEHESGKFGFKKYFLHTLLCQRIISSNATFIMMCWFFPRISPPRSVFCFIIHSKNSQFLRPAALQVKQNATFDNFDLVAGCGVRPLAILSKFRPAGRIFETNEKIEKK